MSFEDVITLNSSISGSNTSGQIYAITFDLSAAVYQAPSQATSAFDQVRVDVLRSNNSVLASFDAAPGAWTGNMDFTTESFTYTGDGTGDIRLRLGPSVAGSGRFNGAFDNVVLSNPAPVPLPAGLPLLAAALVGLGLTARRKSA